MADFNREKSLPPDIQKEMFILGYCAELRSLRRLQYLYKRDTRNFWNEIFCPDIPEETLHYYDTDYVIHGEVQTHLDKGDLELAFIRASGPNIRYDFVRIVRYLMFFLSLYHGTMPCP